MVTTASLMLPTIKKFDFISVFEGAEYNIFTKTARAYETELLDKEGKWGILEEEYFTEQDYPFKIKPNFLGSVTKVKPGRGRKINFVQDDSLRHLSGSKPNAIQDECKVSDYPFEGLSFDNVLLEIDIAHGMIFKGRLSGKNLKGDLGLSK